MNNKKKLARWIVRLVILLVYTHAFAQKSSKDLKTLSEWMIGTFTSEAQAKQDKDFFNIHLKVMPIWKDRADGIWLYVEQAAAESLDKPYRQRIYQLKQVNNQIQSVIYTIPNPLRFAGHVDLVEKFSADSITTRSGCEVVIYRTDKKTFVGNTVEKNCPSELRGASYATTEVTITKDQMISWDRGYNATDEQVWGATKSGYIFDKVK